MNSLKNSNGMSQSPKMFNMSSQLLFNNISVQINNAEQSHPITISCLLPKNTSNKIKLLFTSKDDLFFLYTLEITKQKISDLNVQFILKLQKLEDFVHMFRDLIGEVQNRSKNACLKFSNQSTLTLEITNIINGKEFLIISLVAEKQSHEIVQQWTALKYGEMKEQIRKYEQKIYQLREIIRIKNPYLFTYIDKIN